MKMFFLSVFILLSSPNLLASSLSDKISDEVLDSIIASHEQFINSNILAEICKSPEFLEPDYASASLQKQITDEVHAIASQRGLKEYDATKIRQLAELEFQAFIDGSRYGVFIAKKYQDTMGLGQCSEEIKRSISESQKTLLKSDQYRLVQRKSK